MQQYLTIGLAAAALLAAPSPSTLADQGEKVCVFNMAAERVNCTGPGVTLDEARRAAGVAEAPTLASSATAASYHIGDLWENQNRQGERLEFWQTGPCDSSSDVEWQSGWLGSFNDRTSSFEGFASCEMIVYEDLNFGGAQYGPRSITDYVGAAMNDRASSVRFV